MTQKASRGSAAIRSHAEERLLLYSRHRTQKSFMVQPAPRRSTDPTPKRARSCMSGTLPVDAIAIDLRKVMQIQLLEPPLGVFDWQRGEKQLQVRKCRVRVRANSLARGAAMCL